MTPESSLPLQNRVAPFGGLIADSARGLFMGNRGGRIHGVNRRLGTRRWVSKQWICCRLEFNGRHRSIWGDGYTELFFLDEPTALAAGHRPCFECRRKHAEAFAAFWQRAQRMGVRPRAAAMDAVLHAERLNGRDKRRTAHSSQLKMTHSPCTAMRYCAGLLHATICASRARAA